jgi:alkaline phosphatase D
VALGGLSTAALVFGAGPYTEKAVARPGFVDYPFQLGIASGDPLPDGVVLWTRLAPRPLEEGGKAGMPNAQVPVRWEVAEDERFRRVVQRGVTTARPELAHSVHVEVAGLLPGRWYFYRFMAGGETSPVGRTKTAPALGAQVAQMSYAFVSCQAYPDGFYTAYRHLSEENLDLVVHLGDYLYEYGLKRFGGARGQDLPAHFDAETVTLDQYRERYGLYKSDEDLQAAHAAFPWIVTLDDHEVENNWADEVPEASSETPGSEQFLVRRANAFQAYYENLPLRRSSMPKGPDIQLYRRFRYGSLAEFNVLDGRQYRDDQACGDGLRVGCEERLDPSRTMLGDAQERWLLDGVAASTASWNVLANQVFAFQADHRAGPEQAFGMDVWDGYAAARQRLFAGVRDRGVDNFVIITGDAHRNSAANLKIDFDDPDSATIGSEFLGTSISSGANGADRDQLGEVWLQENPHIKFVNAQRGYVRCELTAEQYRADYRVLPYVTEPGAPISTRASFAIEAGRPGMQQVDSNPVVGQQFSSTFESETELDQRRAARGTRR